MGEVDVSTCKHCGRTIKWSDRYGWYHGVIGAGWNTSCEDDKNRAEPNDEWVLSAKIDLYDVGVPYPKVLHSGVAVRGIAEEPTVSDEAKDKLADLFMIWSRQDEAWEAVYSDHESAVEIVDRIIAAGWGPIKSDEKSGLEKLEELNALFDKKDK